MRKIAYLVLTFYGLFVLYGCASIENNYKVTPIAKTSSSDTGEKFVYALPKTILNIDVIVLKQEKIRGPYADFGQKLLGINANDIISNSQTTYSLFDVQICTNSEPDPEQYYFVEPKKSGITVNVSSTGVIQSAGSFLERKETTKEKYVVFNPTDKEDDVKSYFSERDIKRKLHATTSTPKSKKGLVANFPKEEMPYKKEDGEVSLKKQAEEAADYINKIRQKKLELLSGEYDDQYSSYAIEFMYKNLDSIEQHCLELFIGSVQTDFIKKSFSFEPQRSELSTDELSSTLFKFSETEGILPMSSSSGIPFVIHLKSKNNLNRLNHFLNSAERKDSEGFFYRIPEQVVVSINAGALQKDQIILISQFGTIMNLPKGPIDAVFDPETGNVLKFNFSH